MRRRKFWAVTLLWPLSKVYGWIIAIRNAMFNHGILRQHTFDIPVVVVGNIAVGGTGKTPHTEYLVEKLSQTNRVAVLSRGYKRKTHGFLVASSRSLPDDIGDEPAQIYRKFEGKIPVVVCENRVKGINGIISELPNVSTVVLDDAFQHRYVKPTVSLVLIEYGRPPYRDYLLPYGRLREPQNALNRADIVVVTKCPASAKPMDYREFKENLNLYPFQKLYFSTYDYLPLKPVFPEYVDEIPSLDFMSSSDVIISVTGISNPLPFVRHLRSSGAKVKVLRFGDHHNFSSADITAIERKFAKAGSGRKIIVTTEKDAIRLEKSGIFPKSLKPSLFYLPVSVEILSPMGQQQPLEDAVRQCIRENLNNSGSENC
ncbi:MAG: tetraacyldisaccharide 4'-kinase [Paramuribaculum sp.]|nr:tetraacyldisaccharide 4'-kinase [Bacteroides sp.]MDE6825951.1 tetraacyldisaccharide 4'-kinase [Paramuribaculum sp.]MDE7469820.1 tetraacyldisaccharide 4'-kinase [Paramuribaculum sp.]